MSTRTEQITEAIFNLLNADPKPANGEVHRSRLRKFTDSTTYAVVVRQGTDLRLNETTINRSQRQLRVSTEIYARGDIPDKLADAVIEEVVDRVLADRNLGGLCDDILPGNRVPDWAARDTDLVVVDLEFIIDYEVLNGEL
jgi:hypothetical protein